LISSCEERCGDYPSSNNNQIKGGEREAHTLTAHFSYYHYDLQHVRETKQNKTKNMEKKREKRQKDPGIIWKTKKNKQTNACAKRLRYIPCVCGVKERRLRCFLGMRRENVEKTWENSTCVFVCATPFLCDFFVVVMSFHCSASYR
jgi:hypothetical protein